MVLKNLFCPQGDSADGDETVDVDLYNSAGDLAYQPLIDSRLLIPK
jgi:hypothetical protein